MPHRIASCTSPNLSRISDRPATHLCLCPVRRHHQPRQPSKSSSGSSSGKKHPRPIADTSSARHQAVKVPSTSLASQQRQAPASAIPYHGGDNVIIYDGRTLAYDKHDLQQRQAGMVALVKGKKMKLKRNRGVRKWMRLWMAARRGLRW